MKIGIAGPMTLKLLNCDLSQKKLPIGYDFPMISMLINGLMKKGFDVVAYTTSIGINEPIVLTNDNLTVCIARQRPHPGRELFRSVRMELINLMKKYPADIINAQWSYEFAWSAIDTGIPTIVTLHDHAITILRYQPDPYRLMRLMMNYIVLNKATHLSTNSRYLFLLLSAANKKKTRVIPNFYSRDIEDLELQQVEKSNYILSVCNGLGRVKNIQTGLNAFAIVRRILPQLEYHLIGADMEKGGPAHLYALQKNVTDGVCFIGKVPYDKVIQKIIKAKILLHPSREESFGMTILEAMVLGTPVVGGKKSGNVPYLLNHGNAGVLCDINSPENIAKGIFHILDDHEICEGLIKRARNFAKVNFSEDIIIESYVNYYHETLKKESFKAKLKN